MSIRFTPKFLIAGLLLASVIVFGTMYAVAQSGPSADVTYSDEVTLLGTVESIDDHGFIMIVDSESYYVAIPYTFDKADLGITLGADVSVTGYIADCPNNDAEYIMFHAISINSIVIDHDMQAQTKSQTRSSDGSSMGSGNGQGNGPNYNNRNG